MFLNGSVANRQLSAEFSHGSPLELLRLGAGQRSVRGPAPTALIALTALPRIMGLTPLLFSFIFSPAKGQILKGSFIAIRNSWGQLVGALGHYGGLLAAGLGSCSQGQKTPRVSWIGCNRTVEMASGCLNRVFSTIDLSV